MGAEILPGESPLSGVSTDALECFYDGSKVAEGELRKQIQIQAAS
jgi:hypothetical protein